MADRDTMLRDVLQQACRLLVSGASRQLLMSMLHEALLLLGDSVLNDPELDGRP